MMYQTDLFSHESVRTVLNNFQRVIRALVVSPQGNIASMDMLTPDDLVSLEGWNRSNVDCIMPKSLVHGFHSSVAAYNSSLAVDDGLISLTYEELDQRSDRLASWLAKKGLQKGSIVGIVSLLSSSFFRVSHLTRELSQCRAPASLLLPTFRALKLESYTCHWTEHYLPLACVSWLNRRAVNCS
jgi:non-ribosomal peptide synthetase component F